MFNTDINFYGICILAGFILNIIIVLNLYKKYDAYTSSEKIGLLIYEVMGIVIGAKLFTYLTSAQKVEFNFENLTLSSYGAVIGIILAIFLFSIQFKKNIKELLYIHISSIPLMYSIGKLGCFLVGCCYGIKYNGFGHITYHYSHVAPLNVNLFPIQLVESLVFIIIFIIIFKKVKKEKNNYKIIYETLVFCGISKFLLDFLRASHNNIMISTNQIVSLIFIIIGILLLLKDNDKEKKQKST